MTNPPCRLDFVQLIVKDWPASVAWYAEKLGLEEVMRDEANQFALLVAGGCRVALKAGAPRPGGAALAFEVDDLVPYLPLGDDVKDSAEGYRRLRVTDPDGYTLILFQQR